MKTVKLTMTIVLEENILKIRKEHPEFNRLTDEEMLGAMKADVARAMSRAQPEHAQVDIQVEILDTDEVVA